MAEINERKIVEVELTDKQEEAFDLLMDPKKDVTLLYGGAKGGGKDFLFCVWVRSWMEWLINFFELEPSKTPVCLGFIGRKRSVDFKKTTLEEWKRIMPPDCYRLRDNDGELILHETISVLCGGLDDQAKVKKFNSANYAFCAINQAEETEREEVGVLRAALRVKINGKQPPYKELYTANPGDCLLKNDFIDDPQLDHHFIPALYTDNPHLPSTYRQRMETAFKHNAAILKAYRDGDWEALQSTNTLITDVLLNKLKGITHYHKHIRRINCCDPSLGGDACVMMSLENGKILEKKVMHERDPMKIAGEFLVMGNKNKTPTYALDYSGGLGEAIAARMREVNKHARVITVNSSENARDKVHFYNVRAEMWWETWDKIRERKIPFPEDEELRRQLTAVRFKVVNSDGCVKLEPKDDTKKRLTRSPDEGDCFVIGMYELWNTEPILSKDAWDSEYRSSEIGGGAGSAMTA